TQTPAVGGTPKIPKITLGPISRVLLRTMRYMPKKKHSVRLNASIILFFTPLLQRSRAECRKCDTNRTLIRIVPACWLITQRNQHLTNVLQALHGCVDLGDFAQCEGPKLIGAGLVLGSQLDNPLDFFERETERLPLLDRLNALHNRGWILAI